MKLYQPTRNSIKKLGYSSNPTSIPLCDEHATDNIIGVSNRDCDYCTLDKNKNQYPRIAFCPGVAPRPYAGFDKTWLTGKDIVLVPSAPYVDLFIHVIHVQGFEISDYKRVMLEHWLIYFDSSEPPQVKTYKDIWPSISAGSVIKSLANYVPKTAPQPLVETANQRLERIIAKEEA